MEHIKRNVIRYKNGTRRVLAQGDGIYTISYNRKKINVVVDPFNGTVKEVEAGISFSIKI
jgi:hypothetical protein